MNYHNISHDDMNNGDGLRVVLWVAGCSHHCKGCQNPCTWDPTGGLPFGDKEMRELRNALEKDYISGITLSGGDPLFSLNRSVIRTIVEMVRKNYPGKTIWLYTGYTWESIQKSKEMFDIVSHCDVIVDGKYEEENRDVSLPWRGSSNQRVIDSEKSLQCKNIQLHTN